jgi:hypothetical protein
MRSEKKTRHVGAESELMYRQRHRNMEEQLVTVSQTIQKHAAAALSMLGPDDSRPHLHDEFPQSQIVTNNTTTI